METYTLTSPAAPTLKKKKKGCYILRRKDTSHLLPRSAVLIFAFIFLCFILFIYPYRWDQVWPQLIAMYLSSSLDFTAVTQKMVTEVLASLINTIALAFVTMIIGAYIGLLLGLMATRNLSHPWVYSIVRGFAGLIRAVPTVIWVLISIFGFRLTATIAIVGMNFHSVTYFIKSYSGASEEVDPGAMEVMKASGGSWWQIVWSAVILIPFTKLLPWITMRSEVNFAAAVIIGPAVGVPGTIGSILSSYQRSGGYGTVGLRALAIFMTALLSEITITLYKQKNIVNDQKPIRSTEALSGKEINLYRRKKLFRCRLRRS